MELFLPQTKKDEKSLLNPSKSIHLQKPKTDKKSASPQSRDGMSQIHVSLVLVFFLVGSERRIQKYQPCVLELLRLAVLLDANREGRMQYRPDGLICGVISA